jgi:predicted DNA-binding helix-hairpin-helix protein
VARTPATFTLRIAPGYTLLPEIILSMDGRGRKLAVLTAQSRFDICMPGECIQMLGTSACTTYNPRARGCGRMFKVLLHGTCSCDCAYCEVRTSRERFSFAPRELADTYLSLFRQDRVNGLFLSSGIPQDADDVMAELVESARILRGEGYTGYLHLKILPGAARTDIREAAQYADRVSLNVETTGDSRLRALSGIKDYADDIRKRIGWIAEAAPGRHTTQLVLGAAGESDREVFDCVTGLYDSVSPARIYYPAFQALPKTRLSGKESTPPWRARRWYQVDSLLRDYQYAKTELAPLFEETGTLANDDPKALLARGMERIDPASASFQDLIRVPGIGPKTAREIIAARELRTVKKPRDLGIPPAYLKRAMPYLAFSHEPARQATLSGFC